MAYYYLAAQLPGLSYGDTFPMSSRAFRELAGNFLKAEDAAWLDLCVLAPDGGPCEKTGARDTPEFFTRWNEWERALRLNLARARAARLKRDISLDAPDSPADAVSAAKAAAAMDSPLEAEIFLGEARWKALDLFQGYDYFDRDTIYAYLIKLLLLERRACFKAEEGFTEYKGLYAEVIKAAGSGFDGAQFNQSGEPK